MPNIGIIYSIASYYNNTIKQSEFLLGYTVMNIHIKKGIGIAEK